MMRELAERYAKAKADAVLIETVGGNYDSWVTAQQFVRATAESLADAFLAAQTDRQQPIDADWLRGLEGVQRTVDGSFRFDYGDGEYAIAIDHRGSLTAVTDNGLAQRMGSLRTRGQLLDLLAGLRGDESARGTP